jgi:hypothetical protein
MEVTDQLRAPAAFSQGKELQAPAELKVGLAAEAVSAFGRRGKSFAPTGFRTPDRPARIVVAADFVWRVHKLMQIANC